MPLGASVVTHLTEAFLSVCVNVKQLHVMTAGVLRQFVCSKQSAFAAFLADKSTSYTQLVSLKYNQIAVSATEGHV